MIGSTVRWLRAYAGGGEPRVDAANFFALLVASNQPFYPVYLHWTVSETIWPSAVTFLSTPLFLAVPAVARRNALLGRALLPIAGIANTLACCKMFGTESGVEVFLIPCIALALILFRPSERLVGYGIAGVAFAAYLWLHDHYGAPAHLYSATEYAAFARLNFMSAASLTALVALRFGTILADAETRRA